MFNKLKHLKDLRSQAKTIQGALAQETISLEKNGVKIEMNGNMEITSLVLPDNLVKENLERTLTEGFNEIIKKTQKVMAKKMQEMGGLPGFNQ